MADPAESHTESATAGSGEAAPSPASVMSLWFTPSVDPRVREMFLDHTFRVLTLSTHLAERCRAYSSSLELAVLAHDLGMSGIYSGILLKPDQLEPFEAGLVRAHVHSGAWIVRELVGDEEAAETVLHHHERWDGTGYPFGLVGEDIPLGARVLSVSDVFDTITFEQRPYHDHVLGREEALEEILQSAGSQFDPEVVDEFVLMLEEEPDLSDPDFLEEQARGELKARGVPVTG